MPEAASPEPPEPSHPTDPLGAWTPAGRLDADRLCGKCFHQLDGQPIRRDPRLGLTVVRCPECGTIAPVTEHPVTSRWARRFLALAGAAFVAGIVAAFLGQLVALGMVQYLAAEEVAGSFQWPLRDAAEAAPQDWSADQAFVERFRADPALRARIAADPEARRSARHELAFPFSMPLAIFSAVTGAFWSMLTLHRRVAVPLALGTLVLGLAWIGARLGFNESWTVRIGGLPFRDLASAAFGPEWLGYAGLFCLAVLATTVIVVRLAVPPLARLVLPPKLLAGLASVWEGAGFEPPRRP